MPQRHLDRLTPIDASFLHQEGPVSHMHIGGVTLLEGPPPTMEEFLGQIRMRLHLVPRYRPKLASTALASGRPDLQPGLPRPPPGASLPRHLGAAAGADGADLLPAAGPQQAALGDVDDRGARGRPRRPDHAEPDR